MIRTFGITALFFAVLPASALEPKEVFLLVNKNLPASKDVADHYCQKRGVPAENIILLDVPTAEDISRKDYNANILAPVRAALKDKKDQAKALLSIYGIPLRVGGLEVTELEKAEVDTVVQAIKKTMAAIDRLIVETRAAENLAKTDPSEAVTAKLAENKKAMAFLQMEYGRLMRRQSEIAYVESQACVDSELMLLWWNYYSLARWQTNFLHWQFPDAVRQTKPRIMMTSRLDGPTPEIAKGLVDQAVAVEKKGLRGKVYVDARGLLFDPSAEDGYKYAGYDESMREMASLLDKQGKMTVVLDNLDTLFKPESCTGCALYCGWYSPANFVDCCRFVPGAVAWHLASFEAVSLRQPDAKFWCKNLLQKGVAATLGPVAEPYTIGFPKPAEFFGFLATGKYTLVESYSRTILFSSWMTVLVGDPLYNPFANDPRLKVEQVLASPKYGKPFFNAK